MPPYKAVIFDCDGVLVDSEPITNRLIQASLASYGLNLPEDQIVTLFVGGTIKGVAETARSMGADLPQGWVDGIYHQMFETLRENTPLISGVTQILDMLDSARIPYAVASNGPLEKMAITLGQHDLLKRFNGRIYSAHSGGKPKPNPDMLQDAAQAMRIAPCDCIMVDDSPAGCIAARRAGMDCIGFAEVSDGARLSAEGAKLVHSMGELSRFFKSHIESF